ncbi:protein trapped in endoderm-1-like [Strongylocentrotus purpuratus]|uniref:G-protein coupled receptors family 1 profile domain-containing protein n=1 Tax=Strongylocentrotus purpuratus TaxID=7668 RepID=A0A7M7PTV0_STRPU|nr:protein trapped in endoderm-1-like [Strongylocentrotus purpuratus]
MSSFTTLVSEHTMTSLMTERMDTTSLLDTGMTSDALSTEMEEGGSVVTYPKYIQIIACTVGIPIIVVGSGGNLLTILAVAKSKRLRANTMNLYIVSLCVSDILYCTTILPVLLAVYTHNAWILGQTYCKIYATLLFTFVGATLMCLAAIALSRYFKIRHAAIYNRLFTKYLFIGGLIAIAWMLPLMFLFPAIIGVWGGIGYEPKTLTCTILRQNSSYNHFFMASALILPTAFIVTFYLRIFCIVQASNRRINSHNMQLPAPSNESKTGAGQQRKRCVREDLSFTRMMIAIFIIFIACYFPYIITNLIDPEVKVLDLHFFAGMCCWFSSCLNPVLYVFMNRHFRRAFANLSLWRSESITT